MSDAPAATAPEIAREAAAELDLDGATVARAVALADRHGGLGADRPLAHTPRTVAAAALDIARRVEGDGRVTQPDIGAATGRHVETIRQCVAAMRPEECASATAAIDRRWRAIADGGGGR